MAHDGRRSGMVLLIVLVMISLLTLAGLTFSQLMSTERQAAELSGRQAQALALADSGVEMARIFVGRDEATQLDLGSWYNNPDLFQGVLVVDDEQPRRRGRFTLVAPNFEDGLPAGIRFGLEDESTRLNLNTLLLIEEYAAQMGIENGGRQILMGLPGMDEMIADAIMDWIDPDDEPREFGAEVDSYSGLDPPYAPKNGPLETIEELLLVQGVTPWLLFGVDANRNGYVDPGEPDPDSIEYVDNSDGSMSRGWAAYLTLYSLESNLRPDGTPKIDVNQDDLKTLYDELIDVFEPSWADFIIGYRQNGEYEGNDESQTPIAGNIDLSARGQVTLTTVLDLIVPKVRVQYEGQQDPVVLDSPFPNDPVAMATYLPELMDNLTVYPPSQPIPGRININQAAEVVLAGIPGMTEDMIDQILSLRQEDPVDAQVNPLHRHETWLLAEGIVTLEEMKELIRYVCAGGSVYRAQAIGYFDQDGPAARIEVVFNATTQPAPVIFWRDISHLGRGYPLAVLGIETTNW